MMAGSQYEVLRPIQVADGKVLQPGEIVDADGWKHRELLVQQRRIRPVTAELKPKREVTHAGNKP